MVSLSYEPSFIEQELGLESRVLGSQEWTQTR